jgi:NADH-quinone oxidoreductase subunit H
VLLLLTLMILSIFLGGWSSANRFGAVGAERAALMMLAYEIPLTLVAVGPAILAGSLSISSIVGWQVASFTNFLKTPGPIGLALALVLLAGAGIYVVCLLAELELRPFDIPEAETEIVHGWQVEYSGKKLALLTLGHDIKMVLAAALLTSLFLGGPAGPWPIPPIVWFVIKTTFCVFVLSNLSVLFARFRIDQLLSWAWKYLVPISVLQIMAVVMLAGVM